MKTVEVTGIKIGLNEPVKILGVINLSPESFYKGSVKTNSKNILDTALEQIKNGADIIDIGGKSTAPYLETEISPEEEKERALNALKNIVDEIKKPISIDTTRATVAKAALENGATMINDVIGLSDPEMSKVAAEFDVPIIIGATKLERFTGNPTERIIQSLDHSFKIAKKAGVNPDKIIVDPDIGFHRIEAYKWYYIDSHVLMNLQKIIKTFNQPVCIGLSRKSFIGKILNLDDPKDRLYGSLGATVVAIENGANLIRTHDIKETIEVIRVVEKIKEFAQKIG